MHGARRAVAASGIVGLMGFVASSFALEAFADTPTVLVSSGVSLVADGMPSIFDPTVIWYTAPTCTAAPPAAGLPGAVVAAGAPGDELLPAVLTRSSIYGSTPRQLFYSNPPRPVATCNPYQLLSNLGADGSWLYFVDNQGPNGGWGLEKRSRDANVEDASMLLADLSALLGPAASLRAAEILEVGDYGVLFVILHTDVSDVMVEYRQTDGFLINSFVAAGGSFALHSMQKPYLYFRMSCKY